MKNFKKLSVLIATMLTTTLLLYGCGAKNPRDTVNEYLKKVKKGDMNVQELVDGIEEQEEEKLENDSFSEDTKKKLIKKIKGMTYKINGETIDGETAKVNVTVKGPDLNIVITRVMQEAMGFILTQSISGTEMTEEQNNTYFDDLFSKYLDEVTYSERTSDISLIKVNDQWKIEEDNFLSTLLFGIGNSTLGDGSDPTR